MNTTAIMLSSTKAAITRTARGIRDRAGLGNSVRVLASRSISHLMTTKEKPGRFSASTVIDSTPPPSLASSWTRQQRLQQQRRSIFIQSEETPNPESIKFIPTGITVIPDFDGNGYYVTRSDSQDAILRSPLAKDLFKIDNIKAVYLGADFVTITKYAQGDWRMLRPEILDILMNFFDNSNNVAALQDQPLITDTTILDDDDEVVAMIKELIESRIRPAVQEDGGDIRYVGFEEETGLVTVELAGSCVGCPSSSVTLKQGVENMLQHYIPEVTAVVALEEEQEDNDGPGEGVPGEEKKQKTYEERLKAAGIPFSD